MAEKSDGVPAPMPRLQTAPVDRRAKTPSERQERAEQRLDEHDVLLAKLSGQMDGQDGVLEVIKTSVERIANRDDLVFEGKVAIHTAQAIAKTEVDKTERTTAIEDKADAKKLTRKVIAGLLTGGGVIGVVIHLIMERL